LAGKFFFQSNFKGRFVVLEADTVASRLFQARQILDLNKQGFFFGRRYFAETRQRFGSRKQLFRTIRLSARPKTIALTESRIPKGLRQLDDIPIVAPKHTNWCEELSVKIQK
jgi:hypothetical protein